MQNTYGERGGRPREIFMSCVCAGVSMDHEGWAGSVKPSKTKQGSNRPIRADGTGHPADVIAQAEERFRYAHVALPGRISGRRGYYFFFLRFPSRTTPLAQRVPGKNRA